MVYPFSNYTRYTNATKCSATNLFVNGSTLTVEQRVSFAVVVIILMMLALITNTAMLYVAIRNDKIQTFFRTCLISLACSDLMSALLTGVNYFSQFVTQFNNTWILGKFSCKLFPLLITAGILANGFTLVGISFSRYMAIRNFTKTNWESSRKICFWSNLLVWGSSIGIAGPSFPGYQHVNVFIMTFEPEEANETLVYCGHMCISSLTQNSAYYTILFGILFVPTFVAFLWFNGVLAREVWKRHKMQQSNEATNDNATENDTNPFANTENHSSGVGPESVQPTSRVDNKRERHFRIFCVIVLLTLMYLVLKLPQWLFIVLSVYNAMVVENVILHQYLFGILSMLSAVINPILYAFLTQTVKRTIRFYRTICGCILRFCKETGVALSSVIEPPATESTE